MNDKQANPGRSDDLADASAGGRSSGARRRRRAVGRGHQDPASPSLEEEASGDAAVVVPPTGANPPAQDGQVTQALAVRAGVWLDRLGRASSPAGLFPRRRLPRPRLLPSVIFAGVLMLGFRIGDVWHGATSDSFGAGRPVQAQDTEEIDTTGPVPASPAVKEDSAAPPIVNGVQLAEASTTSLLKDLHREGRSPTEREILEELADRRDRLAEWERALEEREAMQEIAQRRLEEKMVELRGTRDQIKSLLGEIDGGREQQFEGLVAIYENMRPGDAAEIFDGLDMDVLLEVLERMARRRSAPIIASMQPERAREVTRELAAKRALPELPALED